MPGYTYLFFFVFVFVLVHLMSHWSSLYVSCVIHLFLKTNTCTIL